MKILILALFLSLPLVSLHAAERKGKCAGEIEKFCKDKKGPELDACMKSHDAELSKGCKDQAAAIHARVAAHMKEIHQACGDEIEKFCKDKAGQTGFCMKEHAKDFSVGCKAAIAKRP
jgi:hypothetical protein